LQRGRKFFERMRVMRTFLVVAAIIISFFAFNSGFCTEQSKTCYKGWCTGADGLPIGLKPMLPEELPNTSHYKITYDENSKPVLLEHWYEGKRLSYRLTYQKGKLVLKENFDKENLTYRTTYTYNDQGLLTNEDFKDLRKKEYPNDRTKTFTYDSNGKVSRAEELSGNGSKFIWTYQDGLLRQQDVITKEGKTTTVRKYTYGERFKTMWALEETFDGDGKFREKLENPLLDPKHAPKRKPVEPKKTVGDEEIILTDKEITNPVFSPANSPHKKDDTRIGACLNITRPLIFDLFAENKLDAPLLTLKTPCAGGTGYFYYHWNSTDKDGMPVGDGHYPFKIHTPLVRKWITKFSEKRNWENNFICASANKVYFYYANEAKVLVFNPDGDLLKEIEIASYPMWAENQLQPYSMSIVNDDTIYLSIDRRLYKYDMDGNLLSELELQIETPHFEYRMIVDDKSRIWCVVKDSRYQIVNGKKREWNEFAVLRLNTEGEVEEVLRDEYGYLPEWQPFVKGNKFYLTLVSRIDDTKEANYFLASINLDTKEMTLVPKGFGSVVRDIISTDKGNLFLSGGFSIHTAKGEYLLGFDSRSDLWAIQGNLVYSLDVGRTELSCYDLKSDNVIWEDVLIVDNTAPTAAITFPGSDGLVAGSPDQVEIKGTAKDDNFEKYEIYWKVGHYRDEKSNWKLLYEGTVPVENGTLAVWDTTKINIRNIKDMDIDLKIIVTDKAANTIEERFTLCYDSDNDGFSNEFEIANELDKDKATERRKAQIVPHITLLLTRELPINGHCPLKVQLVDETTKEYLDKGLLKFSVNTGTINERDRISYWEKTATGTWNTPDSVVTPATLHVEIPPQGINKIFYTGDSFDMDIRLVVDSDFDGLTDEYEDATFYGDSEKTNKNNPDSDGDGIDDALDLMPTYNPPESFTETYAPGELRFKQEYHITSVAGDESYVKKSGYSLGRKGLMDKTIDSDSVKKFFNDKVYKAGSDDPYEKSPLRAINAKEIKKLYDQNLIELTYSGTAHPTYNFKYTTKERLYEVDVANEEATKYPLDSYQKYGFLKLGISLAWKGDNTVVVQFSLGSEDLWRDEDENGNSRKMFMKYSIYRAGPNYTVKTAEEYPFYNGFAAIERIDRGKFQCFIRIPNEACQKMYELYQSGMPDNQTIVMSPVWVTHRGGTMKCIVQGHPDIPSDKDECLYYPGACIYHVIRNTFSPVFTPNIKLSALSQRFNQYAYITIGRRTARSGSESINYDAIGDIFEHFHPSKGITANFTNGIIPVNIKNKNYSVCYYKLVSTPGPEFDLNTAATFITTNMPNADAVVIQSYSTSLLNCLKELVVKQLEAKTWSAEWVLLDTNTTTIQGDTTPGTATTEQGVNTEQKSEDALDKVKSVGDKLQEFREDAEFCVDLSNSRINYRANQLNNPETWKKIELESDKFDFVDDDMTSYTKSNNVVVEKLSNGKIDVSVQEVHTFTFKKGSTTDPVPEQVIIKKIKHDEVDDIADSDIAAEHKLVTKLPEKAMLGLEVGVILITDGVDLIKAIQKGDGVDIAYYGAKTGGNVGFAIAKFAFKDTAFFQGFKMTKYSKFSATAAIMAVVDVSYNFYKAATADSWLERAEYTEKTAAAVIDGVVGCIEPYGAAIEIGWQIGTFAGNKLCDKFGWGESNAISESATSSLGAAIVFLYEDWSLGEIPSAISKDAYRTTVEKGYKQASDMNEFFDKRNTDDPRWIFIPPDL
jgi:hypothetical protein